MSWRIQIHISIKIEQNQRRTSSHSQGINKYEIQYHLQFQNIGVYWFYCHITIIFTTSFNSIQDTRRECTTILPGTSLLSGNKISLPGDLLMMGDSNIPKIAISNPATILLMDTSESFGLRHHIKFPTHRVPNTLIKCKMIHDWCAISTMSYK